MTPTFVLLAFVTLAGGIAAMSLRNLVHCALALAAALAGLAGLYLHLDAQFVGFAQFLVYIGAVSIVIVFAILLTRGTEPAGQSRFSATWFWGTGISVVVFAVLARIILTSKALARELPPEPDVKVRQIGEQLMTRYVLPLEVVGLLLTAALIGAVIVARPERRGE